MENVLGREPCEDLERIRDVEVVRREPDTERELVRRLDLATRSAHEPATVEADDVPIGRRSAHRKQLDPVADGLEREGLFVLLREKRVEDPAHVVGPSSGRVAGAIS